MGTRGDGEERESVCVCEREIVCVLERVGECLKECLSEAVQSRAVQCSAV